MRGASTLVGSPGMEAVVGEAERKKSRRQQQTAGVPLGWVSGGYGKCFLDSAQVVEIMVWDSNQLSHR
jgi:hypothetical protein